MAKKRANGEGSITKRPNGGFMGQLSIKDSMGEPKRKSVYGKTQKEVQEKMNKIKYELQTGVYTGDNNITVKDWVLTWINEYKKNNLKRGTYANYSTNIDVHIVPNIGNIKLQELRADHIQSFYNKLLKDGRKKLSRGGNKGLSPKTIKRIHILINSSLKQALKNGILNKNVAEAVTLPKQTKHEIQPLPKKDIQKFLEVAKNDRLYVAFLLECGTGLRRGELLGLKWDDIDLKNRTLQVKRSLVIQYDRNALKEGRKATTLEFETPKTEKSKRTISIPTYIVEELKSHKTKQNEEKLMIGKYYNNEDLIFCEIDGTRLHPISVTRKFKKLLDKAEIQDARFHDLRHSVATMLLEENVHPKVVQEVLGHSTITTTLDIYYHVSLEKKEEVAEKLNNIFK